MALLMVVSPLLAGGAKLQYKLKPGQEWVCTQTSQNEIIFMGQKQVSRNKQIIIYKVSKGVKKGWFSVTARLKASKKNENSMFDISRMTFKADMHSSGEIRNNSFSGNPMLQTEAQTEQMPPEMQEMMAKQGDTMGEMMQYTIFWFPEVPEETLQIGDEFEVERNLGTSGMGMQMQSVVKQVFTLEEVRKGLAYFSVKQRSIAKTKGGMGGKSEIKTVGKGEAVFDLNEGMWLDLTEKSRSKAKMGGIPGMGDSSSEMLMMNKSEMELK